VRVTPPASPAHLRTVLFAEGIVAQPTFEALLGAGWVAGLCTARGSNTGAPLRHLARQAGVPIHEVTRNALANDAESWLAARQPDLLLSIAFPYRLPTTLLARPRFGAFNVHGGRLPQYRGPQPVFWQIANRETAGAVTIHRMDAEFDRGPIVVSQPVPIAPDDTHGLHTVRLAFAAIGAVQTLCAGLLQFGLDLPAQIQDESVAGFQRRPSYDDLVIRWDQQSGTQIRALVKASNPWNQGAFASLNGIDVRLADVTLIEEGGQVGAAPGQILATVQPGGMLVHCCDGSALRVDVVSMQEGLLTGAALAALGVRPGERFTVPTQRMHTLPND
jgi:methionyl-tRNA formyltransferase